MAGAARPSNRVASWTGKSWHFPAVYIAKSALRCRRKERQSFAKATARAKAGESPGEVHDIALKAAETDATKRALATFGKPFGLELYRKDKRYRFANSAKVYPGDR